MTREDLKALEFRARMIQARAIEIRTALVSDYGRDHEAAMHADDIVCSAADLCAALCGLQPPIVVPRDVKIAARGKAAR